MGRETLSDIELAKTAIDKLIAKSRVHLYKPIQIAEILFMHRTDSDSSIKLLEIESYRNRSKKWRDIICLQFLGRISTSSAKFQDNLFEDNAIPPKILSSLGEENIKNNGAVEAYIYNAFEDKHLQLETALNYCLKSSKDDFELKDFLQQFWAQAGLKRSLDKIFEMVVYSLFEAIVTTIGVKIDIYFDEENQDILQEFSEFAEKVLNLDKDNNRKTLNAHFHRVGVTNAADRGLDIYANFGSIVQIKHLSLDEGLAENVVTSIRSDKIIIVCKSAEKNVIKSILSQIGWQSRIQSIITLDDLDSWYKRALRGIYSDKLGDKVLSILANEIKNEFPSVGNDDFQKFKKTRGYDKLKNDYWTTKT
jgi:hypothetical protein